MGPLRLACIRVGQGLRKKEPGKWAETATSSPLRRLDYSIQSSQAQPG